MLSFENDYTEGAHPKILERLMETNMEKLSGYGSDRCCESAREKIRAACGCPEADVHFLVGGTQTNEVVIATMLGSCEGVVAARTGHVSVHEAGAIEYTGHKVLEIPETEGKIGAETLRAYLHTFWKDANHEHMVFPGMVYISHPTEYGTLYTKEELKAISEVCQEYGIPLYMDGARRGYGLASRETDVTLPDIAKLCDVFYIGGTKVGALFGEAVVISSPALQRDFRYCIKRHGGMLAKGRLLGLQFEALFEDGLYLQLGRHGVEQALRIREACLRRGLPLHFDSRTNQQFPVLTRAQRERLEEKYAFTFWEQLDDDRAVVRFCASWATDPAAVDALTADLLSLP